MFDTDTLDRPVEANNDGHAVKPAGTASAATEIAPPTTMRGNSGARKRLFVILTAAVVLVAILWLIYYWLVGAHYVSTDDAYVGANVAIVTPQVAGAISEVTVDDTRIVHKGDPLVKIDPADAQLALALADADYGRAVRRVRGYFANNGANSATIASKAADLARAQAQFASAKSDLERARIDLTRRKTLAASGAVSGEELTIATNAYEAAVASRDAALASLAQARANQGVALGQNLAGLALTDGADPAANPEVASAKAALDVARLNLSRTVIRAPIDGMVARRRVQVGQRVPIGADLMTLVPMASVFVDANFKEVQLKKVEPGQLVELTSDQYGDSVVYHGRVAGVGGGTGSAFAIIPAQNATGNWIKVVQRLPVRIALDPSEVARHPLRVGLSMNAEIDVSPRRDGNGGFR